MEEVLGLDMLWGRIMVEPFGGFSGTEERLQRLGSPSEENLCMVYGWLNFTILRNPLSVLFIAVLNARFCFVFKLMMSMT